MAKKTIEIADKPTLDEVNSGVKQLIAGGGGSGSDGGSGIPPRSCKFFRVMASNKSAKLYIEGPDDTILEEQEICRAKGVLVVRKEGSYPETPQDGIITLDLKREDFQKYKQNSYIDGSLQNGTNYFYAAFPYSDHGVYNLAKEGIGSAVPSEFAKIMVTFTAQEASGITLIAKLGENVKESIVNSDLTAIIEVDEIGEWNVMGRKITINELGEEIFITEDIYGYSWELKESDPDSAIFYPAGVTNAGFAGVPKCGTDAEISLGEWQDFFENFVNARPVMLNFDGSIAAELGHDDQTFNIDGTPSDIADTSKEMNAMVEFPKRYFKRWTDNDGNSQFRASRMKLDEGYKAFNWMYGETEETAVENDVIYLPMFEGSSVSSKVRSIAGQRPMNTQTGATEWTQIQALGEGWIFDDWSDEVMITDYMFMMAKSTNVQTHWGNGHYSGGSSASNLNTTGSLKSYGPFYGGTGNTNMKFMWLENYYGDRWTRSFGVWYIANVLYVKMFPPYTVDGDISSYKNIGRAIGGTNGGYISDVTYDENGMIPKTVSGSETTYWPDGCWFSNGTQFLLWGASCSCGLRVGAAFSVNNPFSPSAWNLGPSPAYKKIPKAA